MGHDDRTGFFFWGMVHGSEPIDPSRRIDEATDQVSVLSDLGHCQTASAGSAPSSHHSSGSSSGSASLGYGSASSGSASDGASDDDLETFAGVESISVGCPLVFYSFLLYLSKLDEEQRLNAEAQKEQKEKLASMAETLGGHVTILSSLMKRGRRGCRSTVSERGRGRVASQPPPSEGRPHPRKLRYDDEPASHDEDLGGWVEGIGNPETYYNHISIWVEGAPLPKAIMLEFPLPEGLFFTGMELAVAAYIFGKGLPMG
ncbi:hypothetical protein PIB30_083714 [Stylosanthes scabra]|uniref:Uncharacterized protein n=1 Tax=Stylosanthes scabra TaxID=79078 RepID=A0ABU6UW24_9FABA|nr:hypothetical protein [Stylosanthes scabra]